MKAKDLLFDMISKFHQKFHSYRMKMQQKKCFVTYSCTKVDLYHCERLYDHKHYVIQRIF